jgi:carboxyl-terminal processing protease
MISSLIVVIALAVIAALIIWAVVAALGDRNSEAPEKSELIGRVEAGYPSGAKSVADALQLWEFPDFSKNTVYNVEACYHNSYYKELPANEILAKDTAIYFIKNHYDKIDLSDKDAVTHALCNSFIDAAGDRYGVYRNAEEQKLYAQSLAGELVGIGVMVKKSQDGLIFVTSAISGAPAERAGILAGDVIVAVDGVRVSEVGYQSAANLITGKEGTPVVIRILRGGEEFDLSILREVIEEISVTYEMLDGNIGYVSISRFIAPTAEQFINALNALRDAGAVGIIFDLRGNPGGLLSSVASVLSYIAPTGTKLVSFSNGSAPIYATHGDSLEPTDNVYTLPSVILIDGVTASAAELFTSAMRDFAREGSIKVSIMGERSRKKGVMQSRVSFLDGSSLTITTAYYNPPSGENYDGVGIIPDVPLSENDDPLSSALAEMAKLLNR